MKPYNHHDAEFGWKRCLCCWRKVFKIRMKIVCFHNAHIIIFETLIAKFSQNEDLKEQRKATGDATLAECAVRDRIWGIGLSMTNPDRMDKAKWSGQNLLGYALMLVRDRV